MQVELTAGVEHAVARLKRMVGNINASVLLDKRIASMPGSPVSVDDILQQARARFSSDAPIELRDRDRIRGRRLSVDLELMSQAIVILLENALAFSNGQSVEVALGLDGIDRVEILVSDHGPGIPQDRRERVFELFEQVDSSATRQHEGLGIGLFLARRIARAFGGDIDIRATEGDGATLRLSIPLVPRGEG